VVRGNAAIIRPVCKFDLILAIPSVLTSITACNLVLAFLQGITIPFQIFGLSVSFGIFLCSILLPFFIILTTVWPVMKHSVVICFIIIIIVYYRLVESWSIL